MTLQDVAVAACIDREPPLIPSSPSDPRQSSAINKRRRDPPFFFGVIAGLERSPRGEEGAKKGYKNCNFPHKGIKEKCNLPLPSSPQALLLKSIVGFGMRASSSSSSKLLPLFCPRMAVATMGARESSPIIHVRVN